VRRGVLIVVLLVGVSAGVVVVQADSRHDVQRDGVVDLRDVLAVLHDFGEETSDFELRWHGDGLRTGAPLVVECAPGELALGWGAGRSDVDLLPDASVLPAADGTGWLFETVSHHPFAQTESRFAVCADATEMYSTYVRSQLVAPQNPPWFVEIYCDDGDVSTAWGSTSDALSADYLEVGWHISADTTNDHETIWIAGLKSTSELNSYKVSTGLVATGGSAIVTCQPGDVPTGGLAGNLPMSWNTFRVFDASEPDWSWQLSHRLGVAAMAELVCLDM
jgi:hypothetical protein